VTEKYLAAQGDIIWLDFSPQAGHEQAGRRPALIISNRTANALLNTRAFVCPISNTDKGLSLQPKLDGRTITQGVVLCDQARIQDLQARHAEFIEKAPADILETVVDIVYGMLELL
jgi:mRNA interferase MazF